MAIGRNLSVSGNLAALCAAFLVPMSLRSPPAKLSNTDTSAVVSAHISNGT